MKSKHSPDIELVPFERFKEGVAKVLANTKTESDAQIRKFQAANARKRQAKKAKP